MRRLLPFIFLVSVSLSAIAQCAQTLRLARATYEQGRLHEIESQLQGCLKPSDQGGFKKQEKQLRVEALKILCMSYIYLEEPEKADQAMLNLKLTDPYYEPNPAVDPAEFVALYNSFRKDPIYRIGVRLGGNFSRPNVRELNTAVVLGPDSEYKSQFALHVGAAIDLPIKERLTLHGEILFAPHKFEIDQKVIRGTDPDTGEELTNGFEGIETQNWLEVPLGIEYNFLKSTSRIDERYHPYVGAGVVIGYLLPTPSITAVRTRDDEASIPESGIDLDRESINISAYVSAGIKSKIASGRLVIEVRYQQGLTNISSPETAYSNQKLIWEYGYADSIFNLNAFSINASYMQDIFKPKKIRHK